LPNMTYIQEVINCVPRLSPEQSQESLRRHSLFRYLSRGHAALEDDQVIGDRIATALAAEQMAGLACPGAARRKVAATFSSGSPRISTGLPVASSSSARAWLVEGWNSRWVRVGSGIERGWGLGVELRVARGLGASGGEQGTLGYWAGGTLVSGRRL
jgi:hypothetical protein